MNFKYKHKEIKFEESKLFSSSWSKALKPLTNSGYFGFLLLYFREIYKESADVIIPTKFDDIFNPFLLTDPKDTQVVIITNEPPREGNGLLFGTDSIIPHTNNYVIKDLCSIDVPELITKPFDSSLIHWTDHCLMLNISPVTNTTRLAPYTQEFKPLTRAAIQYLYSLHGDDLIICTIGAAANAEMSDFLKEINFPTDNIIRTTTFFDYSDKFETLNDKGVKVSTPKPVTFKINEKRKKMGLSPYWW